MLGVYFSGTGNSRHSLEVFCKEADANAKVISIEEEGVIEAITLLGKTVGEQIRIEKFVE